MSTATLTDKDLRSRDAVMQQLAWDPAVDASGIGVTARTGAVTLTGSINTYAGKLAAERAAKRVYGVRSRRCASHPARHCDRGLCAMRRRMSCPTALGTNGEMIDYLAHAPDVANEVPDSVQAAVHHGHVTLAFAACMR